MKEKYWFRGHKYGYGWSPSTWQGWVVILLYAAANIYSFIDVDGMSHSLSDTFFAFIPRVFIFAALLIIVTYLKGEPVAWHWGKQKKK